MEGFDTSGLINEFLEDARGHLDKLDLSLLEMEKDNARGHLDVELVSDLLGSLHTMKGNSGMMGFGSLQKYVHQYEGVFKSILEGRVLLNEEVIQRLFEEAAFLRKSVGEIEKNPAEPPDMSEAAAELGSLSLGAEAQHRAVHAGKSQSAGRDDGFRYIGERSGILKVDFERLDHLLNLVGELVIHRTRLAQVEKRFRDAHGEDGLAADLEEATGMVHKAAVDLQEAIMKVRMLPVRHVFNRFPRMVRDLSRQCGKEIEVFFQGENTELDKTVIDEIGEPLVHLIRNSVDHGVEPPEERVRAGKSPVGTISLSAAHEGNNIIVRVTDDGRGISLPDVRDRALALYPAEEVAAMDEGELLDLIFESGFSTAKGLSEVSGRGVGLDVVKKNISRLGGMVEVRSSQGKGTVITIKLPLTLAIISALMVQGGDEVFAIPLASVVESIRTDEGMVRTVKGREALLLRERVLPLVRLSDIYGCGSGGGRYVVVVGRAEKKVGVVVDRLIGRQEVVIKSLGEGVGDASGVAGATIMGDGRVVLILDVAGLAEKGDLKASVCI